MDSFLAVINITHWGHIPILEVIILGQIEQMAKFHYWQSSVVIPGLKLAFLSFFFLFLTVRHELCKLLSRPLCLISLSFSHLLLIFPYPLFYSGAFSLPFLHFLPACATITILIHQALICLPV